MNSAALARSRRILREKVAQTAESRRVRAQAVRKLGGMRLGIACKFIRGDFGGCSLFAGRPCERPLGESPCLGAERQRVPNPNHH